MKRSQQAGFTMTEMMIVVAIVGLLCTIAIPNFVQARRRSQATNCINNLRQLNAAVQQWATEEYQSATATVSSGAVAPYVNHGTAATFPRCPSGGTYQLTTVAAPPTCSLEGTITPDHLLVD